MQMSLNEALDRLKKAGLIVENDAYMDALDKEADEYMPTTKSVNNLDIVFDLVKKVASANGYVVKQEDQPDRFYIAEKGKLWPWAIRVMKRTNDPTYEDCLVWTPYHYSNEVPPKAKSLYMGYDDDSYHTDDWEDLKKNDNFSDTSNFFVYDILSYIKYAMEELYKFEHPFLSKIYNKYTE